MGPKLLRGEGVKFRSTVRVTTDYRTKSLDSKILSGVTEEKGGADGSVAPAQQAQNSLTKNILTRDHKNEFDY